MESRRERCVDLGGTINSGAAGAIGHGKKRSGRHKNISKHVVVDVAAQRDRARFVERHGLSLAAAIELQLECLGRGERIDVVPERIVVREIDRRANFDRRDVWHELLIDLIDDGSARTS